MTLNALVEKNNQGSRADAIVKTAIQLGIGYWTLYRLLKYKKASRSVSTILKNKNITLG